MRLFPNFKCVNSQIECEKIQGCFFNYFFLIAQMQIFFTIFATPNVICALKSVLSAWDGNLGKK